MLTTTSYIHLNPVRATMVKRLEEYEYSSYNIYIGKKEEKLISSEKILSCFKDDNKRKLYQDFVEMAIKLKANEEEKIVLVPSSPKLIIHGDYCSN
jgi:putative transposase